MSVNSLSNLKSDISKEKNNISNLESRYKSFYKELSSAFEDVVGVNAKESIVSIEKRIKSELNDGCLISLSTVSNIEQGYMENNNAQNEVVKIIRQVDEIMRNVNNG